MSDSHLFFESENISWISREEKHTAEFYTQAELFFLLQRDRVFYSIPNS